jgi:hypothetical protein
VGTGVGTGVGATVGTGVGTGVGLTVGTGVGVAGFVVGEMMSGVMALIDRTVLPALRGATPRVTVVGRLRIVAGTPGLAGDNVFAPRRAIARGSSGAGRDGSGSLSTGAATGCPSRAMCGAIRRGLKSGTAMFRTVSLLNVGGAACIAAKRAGIEIGDAVEASARYAGVARSGAMTAHSSVKTIAKKPITKRRTRTLPKKNAPLTRLSRQCLERTSTR